MSDSEEYDDTSTEVDLNACYDSKYLSATEIGDRKIRTTTTLNKVVLVQL